MHTGPNPIALAGKVKGNRVLDAGIRADRAFPPKSVQDSSHFIEFPVQRRKKFIPAFARKKAPRGWRSAFFSSGLLGDGESHGE